MRNYLWAAVTAALLATPQMARSFETGAYEGITSTHLGDSCTAQEYQTGEGGTAYVRLRNNDAYETRYAAASQAQAKW
jgi:hypothetical protein